MQGALATIRVARKNLMGCLKPRESNVYLFPMRLESVRLVVFYPRFVFAN